MYFLMSLIFRDMNEGVAGKDYHMSKRKFGFKAPDGLSFGERLKNIRRAKGITQVELAEAIGVSQRIITYYECETGFPPSHLLPLIAKTLRVSTDELLGIKNVKGQLPQEQAVLWKKLKRIASLSKKDQKILLNLLNSMLNKNGHFHPSARSA